MKRVAGPRFEPAESARPPRRPRGQEGSLLASRNASKRSTTALASQKHRWRGGVDLGTTWEQNRPDTRENDGAGPIRKQDESATSVSLALSAKPPSPVRFRAAPPL